MDPTLSHDDSTAPTTNLQDQQFTTDPIPLTMAKRSKDSLTSLKFEYIDDLPEYPTTDIHGYSYIVDVNGKTQAEAEQLVQEVQYSKHLVWSQKKPVFCPFLQCSTRKWTWKCSGIYACEFLNTYLRSYHHTFVNQQVWEQIQGARQGIELAESNLSRRNAYSYYRAKLGIFRKNLACINQLPSCKPVFKRYSQLNVLGEFLPYIGCINESDGLRNQHHQSSIMGHTTLDLQFLERLFNEDIQPPSEECSVFEPVSSRRKWCDRDHPQGAGKLLHTKCNVRFNALVPVNIQHCPYVIFTSHGVHQHIPPPPHKPPERILQRIKEIIQHLQDPSLTTARFLRTPQLNSFCQQYQSSTLSEIHSSFANKDRISAIIQKERLLSNPQGQGVNGLIFLQNTDSLVRDYIQEFHPDVEGSIILCGFKEQIQLLSQLGSFEVDMSYKRIRCQGFNEVLFSTFLPEQGKIITLLRVMTNQDSTQGYYRLFQRVFQLIEKICNKPVEFHSIHNSGIYGIIMDMDTKQYTGLGQYLSEIDPLHRGIQWQLEHLIVFCKVHFFRSILKSIGTQNHGTGLWSRMASLLECESEEDYDKLIELLIKYENVEVQNWAKHKKGTIIRAGLNKFCSKIQPYFFQLLRDHTNAVEQSHQKSYATGMYLSLTEAVKNSAKLDKDDIIQYQRFVSFNIHHNHRTSNMEANYLRHMSRERNRKRQRSLSHNAELEDPEETQSQSITRSRSRSSRQHNDTESTRSIPGLRRLASTNTLNLEQERQILELRKLKADIEKQEADTRKQDEETRFKQLQNEKLELELIEKRRELQEE